MAPALSLLEGFGLLTTSHKTAQGHRYQTGFGRRGPAKLHDLSESVAQLPNLFEQPAYSVPQTTTMVASFSHG